MASKKNKTPQSKKQKVQSRDQSKQNSGKSETKKIPPGKTEWKRSYLSRPLLPGSWKTNAVIFLVLILATQVLYAGDLHLGFFSVDDEGYIIKNPWIQLNFKNLSHILTTPYFSNFSPAHLLSYMMDYAIGGKDPFVFHLSSNLWAGVVAGFVFLVALALTGHRIISIGAALLFIVHPAHVEAIAWISSRKDLVATAFALPSLLAYLKYRKGGARATRWYILSVVLFLVAVAGKVSVAVFPAVFLVLDLYVEKRSLSRSLPDKIPFLLAAMIIALVVYTAQPLSGHSPDPYVFSVAFGQSMWLLTGFGNYVIYRLRPEAAAMGLEIAAVIFLIALFTAPLLLRRRLPLAVALIYWILLGWLPAQVLSFVHPVTDRYLFFPSVAAVILIAWGIVALSERLGRQATLVAGGLLLVLAFLWGKGTLDYLSEWKDPKSVWFASMKKSSDPDVPYSLGEHYMDVASRLGTTPRGEALSKDKADEIANALWVNDPGLPKLLSEWQANQHGGPAEKEFQKYLWNLASENFDKALATQGTHVFPLLYFRRGVLLLDRGDLVGARKEFEAALAESSLSSVKETRDEITVSCHNAFGAIAWKLGDYREALKWYKITEEEQNRFGGNWVPDISDKRQKMEATVAMLSGNSEKMNDPDIAYGLGVHYLDASDKLGSAPRIKPFSKEEAVQLANEAWKDNSQLNTLLSEWERGEHGTPAEKEFQKYLRKLGWDAFEISLRLKANRVMPQLFFRRGMLLGETGDLKGARKEFLAALDEAARATDQKAMQEYTVDSHDALGVIAWTETDYKDALHWFKLAEEEQTRFGGNWVPDITSKRQRMEAMLNAKNGK